MMILITLLALTQLSLQAADTTYDLYCYNCIEEGGTYGYCLSDDTCYTDSTNDLSSCSGDDIVTTWSDCDYSDGEITIDTRTSDSENRGDIVAGDWAAVTVNCDFKDGCQVTNVAATDVIYYEIDIDAITNEYTITALADDTTTILFEDYVFYIACINTGTDDNTEYSIIYNQSFYTSVSMIMLFLGALISASVDQY
jgi:hypothetical protein